MNGDELVVLTWSGEHRLRAEKISVAAGRSPYTDGLNLGALGIKTLDGAILANGHMEDQCPRCLRCGGRNWKILSGQYSLGAGKGCNGKHHGIFHVDGLLGNPPLHLHHARVAAVGLTEEVFVT
jgi:hypothetical protein